MSTVFERLTALLEERQVQYEVLEHDPVFTSEEAAAVRGTSLASGAQALVCKLDKQFVMFVMPADRRLASKRVRKLLGARSLRFASRDEVAELTGLQPGSIPPFGSLFGFKTYCDEGLTDQPVINFNAGDHARSISLTSEQYQQMEQPELGSFAELS